MRDTITNPDPTDAETRAADFASLDSTELSMGTLTREINLRRLPNWLLRKLMSSLETQRMKKKLGWSRPWNKYGLNIFRSHTHDAGQDAELFHLLDQILASIPGLPEPYLGFIRSLRADPAGMAFTFYHNHRLGEDRYEGLTLSLGRKVPGDKTKRDRLDLTLEDKLVEGKADGKLDRVRLVVNPWSEYLKDAFLTREWSTAGDAPLPGFQDLYALCLAKYQIWKDDPSRQWEHWSVRYIDYFGPRTFIPAGTAFT